VGHGAACSAHSAGVPIDAQTGAEAVAPGPKARDLPVEKRLTGGDPDARTRTSSATQRAIGCVVEAVLALFLVTVVRGR